MVLSWPLAAADLVRAAGTGAENAAGAGARTLVTFETEKGRSR